MEDDKLKMLIKEVIDLKRETQILYNLNDAEMVLMTVFLDTLPIQQMPTELMVKILKSSAHFIERVNEISGDVLDILKDEVKKKGWKM